MENTQTQISEPVIVDSMAPVAPVAAQTHPKMNMGLLSALTVVTLAIAGILVYAFTNAGVTKTPTDGVVTEMPTEEVTETPTPILSGTPLVTPTPTVQGDAMITYIDGNTLQVYTKDLNKVSSIKVTGKMVVCKGPSSGYCIILDKTIRALEVDRAGKLVATPIFTTNFGSEVNGSYADPSMIIHIDLDKKAYAYQTRDPKDEVKITFYKKDFSSTQATKILTWEGGGVSGYVVDAILSTGEVVVNAHGSVFDPGSNKTIEMYNNKGQKRVCKTKENYDTYYKDERIFAPSIMGDENKAQTVELKRLNLVTCKEEVIDRITNINGAYGDVYVSTFNSKFLIAQYTDQQKKDHAKVYQLSNTKNPMTYSMADTIIFGFREDDKTLVGGTDDQFLRIISATKTTTSSKNAQLYDKSAGDYSTVFLIP